MPKIELQEALDIIDMLTVALDSLLADQGCNEDGSYDLASARHAEALLLELEEAK